MSKKISILFVDDEPNVLTAIKRMLRAKRNDWNMAFAESGIDALALFEKTEFDVIVSDIRMPGMDGAKLLSKIKDKYPRVLRIALSGQVNLNEVVTSIQAVHQYISKPCETDELVKKIERAFNSRDILTDPDMQCLVAKIDTLPVIPKVFQLIQKELKKKEPSIDKVAEFISMDVGLVSKIIKLVNSPYFGLPSHQFHLSSHHYARLGNDPSSDYIHTPIFNAYRKKYPQLFTKTALGT
jgi:DNA-binding NarL/FixJ family response regulator